MPKLSSERLEQFCRGSWVIRFTWWINCISSELLNMWIQFVGVERFIFKIRLNSLVELSDENMSWSASGKTMRFLFIQEEDYETERKN